MKRILISVVLLAASVFLFFRLRDYFEKHDDSGKAPAQKSAEAKQLWTCLMHPQIVEEHSGLCPICKMPLTPMHAHASQGEMQKQSTSDGASVEIDPAVVQNMGIRTTQVIHGALQKTVRTVGLLSIPQSAQYDVNLRINGWIEKLYANQEGMHVHKGDVLFDLYSPELQVAAEELIGAASLSSQENLLASARRKFSLWGIADQDIDAIAKLSKAPQTIPFRSPVDGEIQEKMVSQGSAIQSGMKVMRIEDHSKLWLDAQVYEQQLAMIKPGQTMQATVESVPGKHFDGTVELIYPHLDHMTRTVTVRATLDNADHQLRPGMYASVDIFTKPMPNALLVPREAVIDTGTRQIVFTTHDPGHFDPHEVHMGLTGDNDQVQILDGLKEGDTVVTSGQFLLDVTSRTNEAIEKLQSPMAGK